MIRKKENNIFVQSSRNMDNKGLKKRITLCEYDSENQYIYHGLCWCLCNLKLPHKRLLLASCIYTLLHLWKQVFIIKAKKPRWWLSPLALAEIHTIQLLTRKLYIFSFPLSHNRILKVYSLQYRNCNINKKTVAKAYKWRDHRGLIF